MSIVRKIRPVTADTSRPRYKIWQNYYANGQHLEIDPDFVPNDGRRNARTDYREVALFLRMYHADLHKQGEYTGMMSPKFASKTRLRGAQFIDFMEANPGYDVYFINPFPQNAYYSFNVWSHGEHCHPGLTLLAQNLFDRAGFGFNIAGMGRNSPSTLLYSNYWVGNEVFWDRFMDVNLRLLSTLEAMSERDRAPYFAHDADYADPVPVLPFVFERLFSTMLLMDSSIRALGWRHTRAEVLRAASESAEEYRIVLAFKETIDEIDRRGVYDPRDRAVFRSVMQLKLLQGVVPQRDTILG
jgi:hypothetical protein